MFQFALHIYTCASFEFPLANEFTIKAFIHHGIFYSLGIFGKVRKKTFDAPFGVHYFNSQFLQHDRKRLDQQLGGISFV